MQHLRMLQTPGTLVPDACRHTLPGPNEAATPRDPLPRSRSHRSRRGLDIGDQPGVGRLQGDRPPNQAASPAAPLAVQPQPELAQPGHQTPGPARGTSGRARPAQPRAASPPPPLLLPGDSTSLSHSGSSSSGLTQPRGSGASGGHTMPGPPAAAPLSMPPFLPRGQQGQQRHHPQGRGSPAAGDLLRPPAVNGVASVVDIDSAKRNGRMLPANRSGPQRMQLPQPGTLGAEPPPFSGVHAAVAGGAAPLPRRPYIWLLPGLWCPQFLSLGHCGCTAPCDLQRTLTCQQCLTMGSCRRQVGGAYAHDKRDASQHAPDLQRPGPGAAESAIMIACCLQAVAAP